MVLKYSKTVISKVSLDFCDKIQIIHTILARAKIYFVASFAFFPRVSYVTSN